MGFLASSIQTQQTTTSVQIFNIPLGIVNTEQSQVLPNDTKEFIIKSRNNALIKLSYVMGESGIKYITIKGNAVYTDTNLYQTQTLYFQSPQTGDVVEIVAFT